MASSSRAHSSRSSPPMTTFHALKGQCNEDITDGYEVYHNINECLQKMQLKRFATKKKITEIKSSATITISEEMHADYLEATVISMNEIIEQLATTVTLINKKIDLATMWKLSAEDGFK